MKKILIIILSVAITISLAVYAYIASDIHIPFIDNYSKNFSENFSRFFQKNKNTNSAISDIDTITSPEPKPESKPQQSPPEANTQSNIESTKVSSSTDADLPMQFVLSSDPVALSNAASAKYARYNSGILCVLENSITLYDSVGSAKWVIPIQLSNPVIKTNGTYILVFEQNGNKFAVFNNDKILFESEVPERILNGNISSKGDSVIVTEKKYYKGATVVYNVDGQEIFSRSFGSEHVLSAAISDSRRLSVSLMSATPSTSSKIVFLDINKTETDISLHYENSIIYDLDFSHNTLYAYADDKLITLNSNGREISTYHYESKTLLHYQKDKSEIRILLFDNNNNSEMALISSGKLKRKISTDIIPDFCDIYNGYIIYNNERGLFLTNTSGDLLAYFSSSRDIKKAYFINSDNILVVYNSSYEFLNISKK